MIQEIKKVDFIIENLLDIISKSPFKLEFVIEKSQLSKPTFYRKIKNKSFTTKELMNIAKVLEPNYETTEEIVKSLYNAKSEIEKGKFISHKEVMNSIKKRQQNYENQME